MKRSDIRNAYDQMNPTPEQKDKMYRAILDATAGENKVKGKYQAKPTTSHRWSWIPAAAALIAVIAAGFFILPREDTVIGNYAESVESESTESLSDSEIVDTSDYLQEGSEAMERYARILEKYKTAIAEKWNPSKCVEEGISILIVNYVENPEQFGYTLMDLDGDGTQELIITDGNELLDVYQQQPDRIQRIVIGWERDAYYLCEDNKILNRGSNSAANTVYNLCYISNGGLTQTGSVIFDATDDPSNPWFYQFGSNEPEPIKEDQAREMMDAYVILTIDFTPITEINECRSGS